MKYRCSVEINLPIDKVVQLWIDENNFKKWQDDFHSIEHLSGEKNSTGAKNRIIYQGRRRIELIETIISINLPNEKTALYEHVHMTNKQTSRFESVGKNKTLYISEIEYTKFSGIIPKLMSKVFMNKFKEQSQKWLNQFKNFAESTTKN